MTKAITLSVILPQAVVECALSMSGMVHKAEATRVIGDVRITTTTVVNIDYGLGVDMSKRLSWALKCRDKGP